MWSSEPTVFTLFIMKDSTLYIMGGTTKSDIPGFVDVRRIPEEGNDGDANAVTYQEDQNQQSNSGPQYQSKFDDRPPRAWLPRVFWILRHFFALPSVSQLSVEVRELDNGCHRQHIALAFLRD